MDNGLWIMDYGLWFMVYGLWFMDYGLWFMDYKSPSNFMLRIRRVTPIPPPERVKKSKLR